MTDFNDGPAAAPPSNFNIFTHSLKQEFTSIYDGVRLSLPSISVDDLSDESDGSQGEAEPIVFSQIDHEKTAQALAELSRPVVRGQSGRKVEAVQQDEELNSSRSDDDEAGSAVLHHSAADMVKSAMQRRPAAAGGSAAYHGGAAAPGSSQSSRAAFNSMQAAGSFDRHRARVEEHSKLQSSSGLSVRSADRDAQYSAELEARARGHIDNHNYLEADDDLTFRISVAEPSPSANVYSMRGYCRRMLGQYDEALRDFATALELDEDDQRAFHEYRRLSRMLKETKTHQSAKGPIASEVDAAFLDRDSEAYVEEQFWKDVRQAASPSALRGDSAPKDAFSLDLALDGIDLDGLLAQCLAQQDAPAVELPDVECHDVDCVEPLRPSKDGNSSSASSSGSGRLSPLPGDVDMKQNSAAVEQMILASSRSSRQAMGNLRSGSQPFAPLQKDVKENVMVRKPRDATATSPAVAQSSAAANSQLPKSRFTIHDSSSSEDDLPLPAPLRRTGGAGVPNKSGGSSSLRYRM
jgi:tetratricopeptide (TPR) repeat protein